MAIQTCKGGYNNRQIENIEMQTELKHNIDTNNSE